MPGSVGRQCLLWLIQLDERQVGDVHEVVECGGIDGGVLVGHQAQSVEVVGGGDDDDGEAGRIGVEVVGMECQLATIVANRQPPLLHQRKDVAGEETLRLVRPQRRRGRGLKAVQPTVPLFCRVARV